MRFPFVRRASVRKQGIADRQRAASLKSVTMPSRPVPFRAAVEGRLPRGIGVEQARGGSDQDRCQRNRKRRSTRSRGGRNISPWRKRHGLLAFSYRERQRLNPLSSILELRHGFKLILGRGKNRVVRVPLLVRRSYGACGGRRCGS